MTRNGKKAQTIILVKFVPRLLLPAGGHVEDPPAIPQITDVELCGSYYNVEYHRDRKEVWAAF